VSANLQGIVTQTTLDGTVIGLSGEAEISRRRIKSLRETATGGRVEARTWWGEDALADTGRLVPVERLLFEILLRYRHLRSSYYDTVEELLSWAGPHRLCLWKPATIAYQCDGARSRFWLPWISALDELTPPQGLEVSLFEPAVWSYTRDSTTKAPGSKTDYTVVPKTSAAYAAGTPSVGEAWWITGGQEMKLNAAPAATVEVFVRMVPVFTVAESTDTRVQYPGQFPGREPRDILLLEVR